MRMRPEFHVNDLPRYMEAGDYLVHCEISSRGSLQLLSFSSFVVLFMYSSWEKLVVVK